MIEAWHLLASTPQTLTQIEEQLGYQNLESFIRRFEPNTPPHQGDGVRLLSVAQMKTTLMLHNKSNKIALEKSNIGQISISLG